MLKDQQIWRRIDVMLENQRIQWRIGKGRESDSMVTSWRNVTSQSMNSASNMPAGKVIMRLGRVLQQARLVTELVVYACVAVPDHLKLPVTDIRPFGLMRTRI